MYINCNVILAQNKLFSKKRNVSFEFLMTMRQFSRGDK